MKLSTIQKSITLCLSIHLTNALFPQDLTIINNCKSCVQQQSTFNYNLNTCGSSSDCDIDRCCTTIDCCVNDGCRSPTEFFAYDAPGEFTTRCETCCDPLQTPDFDKMQDFLKMLVFDRCNNTALTNSSGGECQMSLAFTDSSLGFATFTVKDAQVLDSNSGQILAGINVSADIFDQNGELSSGRWAAEPFLYYNSMFSPNACPTALNFYAEQLSTLGRLGRNASYSFVQSVPNHCSYFSQSLVFKYAAMWFNLLDISESKLGKTQVSDFSLIPKLLENDFPKYCQYRYFVNETGVTKPYYNKISQSPCVDTYQYPPSCPKCALCTKHDEELLLSQVQLSTDELAELAIKCPYMMSSVRNRSR